MLKTILQYTEGSGNPKPIVYWERVVSTITRRTNMYTDRVMNGSLAVVPWVRFIKALLKQIPVSTLLNIPSVSTRYSTMLLDIVERINDFIAPNYTIKMRSNYFTTSKNNGVVQEYIVPCRSETPLMDLPLGDNIHFWNNVHPIHILYNDSLELCSDFLHSSFNYTANHPRQVIVTIDTPALVFLYYTYCEQKVKDKQPIDTGEFIQKHLMPNLYTDIVNCWIFQMLERGVVDNNLNMREVVVGSNICALTTVENGTSDFNKYWANLVNKSYSVFDFLSTGWLANPGLKDIVTYIKFLKHDITMPLLRQNQYIKLMITFPILKLIIKSNNLSDRSECKKMNLELNRHLLRIKMSGVTKACYDIMIQTRIEKELDELIVLSSVKLAIVPPVEQQSDPKDPTTV